MGLYSRCHIPHLFHHNYIFMISSRFAGTVNIVSRTMAEHMVSHFNNNKNLQPWGVGVVVLKTRKIILVW